MKRSLLAVGVLAVAAAFCAPRPLAAMPVFAERYALRCTACHSVLPELNAFGNAFRDRGYRLPGLRKHGTTIVALREQIGYSPDPAPGAARTVAASVGLAAVEVGAIEGYLHYNFGSQGGPGAAYLAYVAHQNPHTRLLVRAGLVELPLVHSPAQRLDDLNAYGFEALKVGLNDLLLIQPRRGVQLQYPLGRATLYATYALGEYQGAAYGGKPIATGVTSRAARPEIGFYARAPIAPGLAIGLDALSGARAITPAGRGAFGDPYTRLGANLAYERGRFDLLAEQWHGFDGNADGTGSAIASNGGYLRVRWAPNAHAFVALRYDAQAAPVATRALTPYVSWLVTPHARLLLEDRRTAGGTGTFGAALTIGFPWPNLR